MSSRALRKLQSQQEQARLAALQADDSTDDEENTPHSQVNAFNLLMEQSNSEASQEERSESEEEKELPAEPAPVSELSGKKKKNKKRKNKKRKDKKKVVDNATDGDEVDEIDIALQQLGPQLESQLSCNNSDNNSLQEKFQLLAIDSKNLNPMNEMKRLFGRDVIQHAGRELNASPATASTRRRGAMIHLDLGSALSGRYNPSSKGQVLSGMALRKNVFMPGNEEWPKATGGGLGMVVEHESPNGESSFNFVHNSAYQDVQQQFELCVQSMDPQRMVHLLQFNPYHVASLLQVSEIAEHQGDHSVAGDLLERALFTFGRSATSGFIHALHAGKARLSFECAANRELFIAAWRYIRHLGRMGTWKTAYEWGKLLYSLDSEDPYRIRLILGDLAIRANEDEHFSSLIRVESDIGLQNLLCVRMAVPLIKFRANDLQAFREELRDTMAAIPWVFRRLFEELNIGKMPKSIWGKTCTRVGDQIYGELYLFRAKDLWNTPEIIAILVEIAETLDETYEVKRPLIPQLDWGINLTRHIFLTEEPSLISLLPPSHRNVEFNSSDPLPPDVEEADEPYSTSDDAMMAMTAETVAAAETAAAFNWTDYLRFVRSWFRAPAAQEGQEGQEGDNTETDENAFIRETSEFLERFNEMDANERINAIPAFRQARDADIPPEERERLVEQLMVNGTTFGRQTLEALLRTRRIHRQLLLDAANELNGNNDAESATRNDRPDFPREMNHTIERAEAVAEAAAATATAAAAAAAEVEASSSSRLSNTTTEATPTAEELDERNQRWLAGRGLFALKDFCTANGTEEKRWAADTDYGIVLEYANRVKRLMNNSSRQFILKARLPQGAGQAVKELVDRVLADTEAWKGSVGSA